MRIRLRWLDLRKLYFAFREPVFKLLTTDINFKIRKRWATNTALALLVRASFQSGRVRGS